MPIPIIGALEAIGMILSIIPLFKGPGKIDKEAEVAAAIQAVQDRVGLTKDVKWAWNWFDNRYIDELSPTYYDEDWSLAEYQSYLGTRPSGYSPWRPYVHYAGHHLDPWDDVGWWKDMCSDILMLIQYHLNRAVEAGPPPPVAALPAFLDKLKKYAPYIALGGAVFFGAIIIGIATRKER